MAAVSGCVEPDVGELEGSVLPCPRQGPRRSGELAGASTRGADDLPGRQSRVVARGMVGVAPTASRQRSAPCRPSPGGSGALPPRCLYRTALMMLLAAPKPAAFLATTLK